MSPADAAVRAQCEQIMAAHVSSGDDGDCAACGAEYPCDRWWTAYDLVENLDKLAALDSPVQTVLGATKGIS